MRGMRSFIRLYPNSVIPFSGKFVYLPYQSYLSHCDDVFYTQMSLRYAFIYLSRGFSPAISIASRTGGLSCDIDRFLDSIPF